MSDAALRIPVFADVDTGVDDAVALTYLLAAPDAELVGIASTAGNVDVEAVTANNLGLLQVCRAADIPVSRGAPGPLVGALRTAGDTHGRDGMGYARLPRTERTVTDHDAAQAWIRAAHTHPGRLVGLAVGPLTNLALALRLEPALPQLLRRLVIMGGSFDHRGNTTPVAEWNISVDPEAAAEVFAAWGTAAGSALETPIVLGLNVTERVVLTPQLLARLAGAAGCPTATMSPADVRGTASVAPNPLVRVLEDALRFYFEFHADQGEGYLAHLHDPLAAAVALDPSLVATRPATVDVELSGRLTRGMTVADWHGRWGRRPNARVGVATDPAVVFDRLIDRVGSLARRLARDYS